jgi:hypothetical protein
MNINGNTVRVKDARMFFADKNRTIMDAGNTPELKQRLQWLSQGVLKYHLDLGWPSEVCRIEKLQYKDFIAWTKKLVDNINKG